MVTAGMSYTSQSRTISEKVAAIYFAAEPKPGQWSVTGRSLSMVLGAPITDSPWMLCLQM